MSGNALRRSIEVEYWVIDDDGRLVEPDDLVNASRGVEREFVQPLLEIKTTPCATTAELRQELFGRIEAVLDRADAAGKGLVPLATPVGEELIRDRPNERTRVQDRVLGEDFEYVRHCAGTHLHVEQSPGEEVDQLNALTALDPALALVNSSPYYRGRYVAAGARSKLYRWLAYDDLAHQGRLWRYLDDREQWTRRLERRYEEFERAASEAGVDRRALQANFDPESAIWTPVQLRDTFGTVEWRSPDTTLPSHAVSLADDVATVATRAAEVGVSIEGETGRVTDDEIVLPTFDTVIEHVNAAIREGLGSDSLRSYLEDMGFDVGAYEPLTHDVEREGTVTGEDARRIRLEQARRLERDVRGPGSEAEEVAPGPTETL
jgi:gamma-glutamyl:cysteine ligase YbdK (ATP-grasp superfamily)